MTRPTPGRHARPRTPLARRAVTSPAGVAALGAVTAAGLLTAGTAQAAVPSFGTGPGAGAPFQPVQLPGAIILPSGPITGLPPQFSTTSQVIAVRTTGTDATVTAWQRNSSGTWTSVFSTTAARIGANGIAGGTVRQQGTDTTPTGVYSITQGFGVGANPGTKMPYHQVTSADWWVEDPSSPSYNRMRTAAQGGFPLTEAGDHGSEHLINYPTQYHNALVVNFNTSPPVPGRGAGIFLHDLGPQAGPTAGCVALPAAVMTQVMQWIDPAQHPVISIQAADPATGSATVRSLRPRA